MRIVVLKNIDWKLNVNYCSLIPDKWWYVLWSQLNQFMINRHKIISFRMMTSSNRNIFRVTGHLCGISPVTGEFPAQRPMTRSFDVFFDLCLNERLSKQWRGWWFETPSCPLLRHCNGNHHQLKCTAPYFVFTWALLRRPITSTSAWAIQLSADFSMPLVI